MLILSPGFTLLNLANTGFSHLYLKVEPKLTALNIVLYANTMPCFAFFLFTELSATSYYCQELQFFHFRVLQQLTWGIQNMASLQNWLTVKVLRVYLIRVIYILLIKK